ncbi:MAG: hypothetical protein OEV92_08550, partial [Nitrospinota bacterium]|nr:hypothetical protein [Nitrospinota bacterium]
MAGNQEHELYHHLRKDYFGRALLFHIEKFFPTDRETSKRILLEPVDGFLPRQIAQGIINAIKESQAKNADHFTNVFNRNVARHTFSSNGPDYIAFSSDGNMRSMVAFIIKKFEKHIKLMSDEEARKWLSTHIASTETFSAMQRDITDQEMNLLLENIFNV